MKFDELQAVHDLLLEVAKYEEADLERYEKNEVYAHHIHKDFEEHKKAVRVLTEDLSDEIDDLEPLNWSHGFEEEPEIQIGEWKLYDVKNSEETLEYGETHFSIHRNGGENYKWMTLEEMARGQTLEEALDEVYSGGAGAKRNKRPYGRMAEEFGYQGTVPKQDRDDLQDLLNQVKRRKNIPEFTKPPYIESG